MNTDYYPDTALDYETANRKPQRNSHNAKIQIPLLYSFLDPYPGMRMPFLLLLL